MSAQDDPVTLAEAFARVPRRRFLPADQQGWAESNVPLEIGCSQTNSQPSTVADMLSLLDVEPGQTVLDLGSGSGWTTALLGVLVGGRGRVIGVERHRELLDGAIAACDGLGFEAIEFAEAAAGTLGLPERAPFDRILVSAEAKTLPGSLVEQLVVGGVMVIPVSGDMLRVERTGETPEDATVTRHGRYRFVPLIEE
ncbi:methyltransferase domain-containing protein [Brevibacterium casei]|uniref:protein-L-isoaspartate O-methyltransferase family protein n=1 Tax=Brevibacterium casei TaxID=33889 RepID=UPI0034510FF9